MRGWPLDTNILSAVGRGRHPVPGDVVTWIRARTEALHLTTISVAEIEAGIAKLRRTGASRRADHLHEWFDRILDDYADRVLSFDLAAAKVAGALSDAAQAAGRHPSFTDA